MADQHNQNIPAVGNQISADIPDIKENLEFHKDAFQVIFETWSDSDNSSAKINTATGFYDGTYNYEFPTNGVAGDSVIMLGDSDTIIWMYLNTAPPGWKALSTGADSLLAISGGTAAYNVNGGNGGTGDTWTQPNHTHTMGTHQHVWYNYTANESESYASGGAGLDIQVTLDNGGIRANAQGAGNANLLDRDYYTNLVDPGDTAGSATANTWRPLASVGKLFQLDTA
jgi:hypothetical protein